MIGLVLDVLDVFVSLKEGIFLPHDSVFVEIL